MGFDQVSDIEAKEIELQKVKEEYEETMGQLKSKLDSTKSELNQLRV